MLWIMCKGFLRTCLRSVTFSFLSSARLSYSSRDWTGLNAYCYFKRI